jgi:hypothetical protein
MDLADATAAEDGDAQTLLAGVVHAESWASGVTEWGRGSLEESFSELSVGATSRE